jgi:hypothetical protein
LKCLRFAEKKFTLVRDKRKTVLPKSGAFVTEKVGIKTLKDKCRHFGKWIAFLEELPDRR